MSNRTESTEEAQEAQEAFVPHKSPPGTIDMTPSPAGYKQMLELIVSDSTSAKDRRWAAAEMVRIEPAVVRGWWHRPHPDCDCANCRDHYKEQEQES